MSRAEELESELRVASNKHRIIANIYRTGSLILMFVAVISSGAASIAGILYGKGTIAGALALLPPITAFAAINLKLDPRASWARHKEQALD